MSTQTASPTRLDRRRILFRHVLPVAAACTCTCLVCERSPDEADLEDRIAALREDTETKPCPACKKHVVVARRSPVEQESFFARATAHVKQQLEPLVFAGSWRSPHTDPQFIQTLDDACKPYAA
jgi:hypothetical protein